MSPRYILTSVEPETLQPGDRIHVKADVPGATYVSEYVVATNDVNGRSLRAVDAYSADAEPVRLRYDGLRFELASA